MTLPGSRTTDGRGRLYDSVVDTIGNTPCIRVNRIAPKHVRLYVKAEYFNPASSVKDRLAIGIIEEAERRGDLKPGQTVGRRRAAIPGSGWRWFVPPRGTRWWSRWPTPFPSSAAA
jgi:cysteine synthase